MRDANRTALVWVILSMTIVSTACSSSVTGAQATEDTTYLTPIPETTLAAYRPGSPIESKLQAVIAARASLGTTRLRYAETPEVAWAEEMKLEDAHKRVAQPGVSTYEDRPGDTKVWLVVFEGEWLVIPPAPLHTVTPPPPSHGCAYVILDVTDSGHSEIGTMECPSEGKTGYDHSNTSTQLVVSPQCAHSIDTGGCLVLRAYPPSL